MQSALLLALSMTAAAAALALAFPEQLFALFIRDAEVLRYARPLMALSAGTLVLSAINGAFDSVVLGTGNANLKLLAGFLDGVVLRILLGLYFGIAASLGVIGFFMGHCFARLAPVVCNIIYYISGKWKTRQLL